MQEHALWMKRAASSLQSAIKLSKNGDDTLEAAAYHAQQCAEKALNAYLAFQHHNSLRTYGLEKLLEICTQYDASFQLLASDALDLSPHAEYSSSPDKDFYIDRPEVEASIAKAEKIFDFVKAKIEALSGPNLTIF